MKKLTSQQIEEHILMSFSEFSPMSYVDYAEIAGIVKTAAHGRIGKAWDSGLLYIADWHRGRSGRPMPLYAIGRISDAPRPDAYTVAEKVARYQASERGKVVMRKWKKRRSRLDKKRRETDPVFAERTRHYSRELARRKHGHKPRRAMVNVAAFDPVLAAMMGVKK